MFRHVDGALAGFNGMGVSEPETLATVLAHGDVGLAASLTAPDSGYQRLQAAEAVVIVDVGAPPPWALSREAHAGCLSFEFSSGLQRLIVNCGAPSAAAVSVRDASRATAAHSTLVIDDHSSCSIAPAGESPSPRVLSLRAPPKSPSAGSKTRLVRASMRGTTAMSVATGRCTGVVCVLRLMVRR